MIAIIGKLLWNKSPEPPKLRQVAPPSASVGLIGIGDVRRRGEEWLQKWRGIIGREG